MLYQDKHLKIFFKKLIMQKNVEEDDSTTMFFLLEKQHKTILNFSLDPLSQNSINNGTSITVNLLNEESDFKFVNGIL